MIAYFDCFAGIAGDMALAALLDCGVPLDELKTGLASLPVSGWNIEAEDVLSSGIHAKNVRITLHGQNDDEEAEQRAHHHGHHHNHHGRSMAEIRDIINGSCLSTRVKQQSLDIFQKIAEAEAYLHHSTPDEVHFHEIGGIDSLIDICGVAWCLEYLGVQQVFCSALPHSTGFVDCAHGRMPVPAPATLEILKGAPWTPTELQGELVTPTGAAIVTLAQAFGAMPPLQPRKIGFGAGKKTLADRPNVLRVVIGDATASQSTSLVGLQQETLAVIECNIDDMNPEFYDLVSERLFEAGALDVWLQNIQMKKNRPAILLTVLCANDVRDALIGVLMRDTTTLGVRCSQTQRFALPREQSTVHTEFGEVRVKIANWPEGEVRRVVPEYSDVARLARECNVSPREIYEAALKSVNDRGHTTAH